MKHRLTQTMYFCFLWGVSIFVIAKYDSLDIVSFFFLVCAGFSYFILLKKNAPIISNRSYRIKIWLISIFLSFLLQGRTMFMQKARFDIDFVRIVDFFIVVFVLYPLTLGIIELLKILCEKKIHRCLYFKNNLTIAVLCGGIVLTIDTLLSLGYYPCTMTGDSVSHWEQAVGIKAMSDYSPIAYNLLLKGLFSITNYKSPYIYVLFQIFILSCVVAEIVFFFHRRGVNAKVLLIGTFIFAICPSTYMLLLYLSKNPLTGILALALVISLFEIIVEPNYYFSNPLWYVKTVFVITGLYLIRENNIVIAIPLICFFVWCIINLKEKRKNVSLVAGGVILLLVFIQLIVYRTVDYEHVEKNHETIRPLLAPVASALSQDLPVPEEITIQIEKVLPLSEWANRYDPYSSDYITWGDPKPKYSELSIEDGMKIYMTMLQIYPDIVIRDRLDGMNLIWDIKANVWRCPTEAEDHVSFKHNILNGYFFDNMRAVSKSLFLISARESLIDMFVWKNGIYLYLLLVVCLFLFERSNSKLVWAIMPSIFILLTYVLVIAWQMYFYIWFFPLSVALLTLTAIVECRKLDTED